MYLRELLFRIFSGMPSEYLTRISSNISKTVPTIILQGVLSRSPSEVPKGCEIPLGVPSEISLRISSEN